MDNNYDINSSFDFLLNHTLKTDIDDSVELQDKILNSQNFNTTYAYIEKSLNFLYEKNRLLQDVISYSKSYIQNEINTNISDCKTLLKSIEDDKNLIKNKTYINYTVPFFSSITKTSDRDNSVLNSSLIYNNNIMNANDVISSYNISSFAVKRNNICIYENSSEYLKTNRYRTLYMFNNIQGSAIEETLILNFNKPIKINHINIDLSNCYIKSIKLNLESNNSISIDVDNMYLFDEQNVISMEILIASKNYSMSQIKHDDIKKSNFTAIINNINTDENLLAGSSKYYYYLFGIDSIDLSYINQEEASGFYSQDINIGSLKSNENLTIYAEDSVERGSIEYYIVNNKETIPILPENKSTITDEKIFYKTPTRFTINYDYPVIIKKNGNECNLSLYDVMNIKDDNLYTISYTPERNSITNILNDNIKIKVIIRSYDKNFFSFIKTLKVRKYGGNNLWIV